jgi:LytS/YehU family sensor histidine kinase
MKDKGKNATIILLLSIFIIGLLLIIFWPDRFESFISLVQLVLVPMLTIMFGIIGQSIAKVIKGEKKIEEVEAELRDDGK